MQLVQIVSRLSADKSKDGTQHTGKRIVPFPTLDEFRADPAAALAQWIVELRKLDKGVAEGVEAGKPTKRKVPYRAFGSETSYSPSELYALLWRGFALQHQAEMLPKLRQRFGKPGEAKVPTGKTSGASVAVDDSEIV